MDVSLFARLFPELLSQHNRVSLPGMGSFVAAEQPPKLVKKGRLLKAPGRVIRFSVDESWNDELLECAYSAELNLSMPKPEDDETASRNLALCLERAKREIAQLVVVIKIQFRQSGAFDFPRFGTLKSDDKDQVTFVQSTDCPVVTHAFGLPDLAIKPLGAMAAIEELYATRGHRRVSGIVYVLLGVLLWLAMLICMAYLFRDRLTPVLERLLYTPEERSIIHAG
ncbi:MAG: hypothetical protein FWG54_00245 [Bacteroidetes bacterium]|nr:hypothetical protein [Bacteroidota bacterium]